MTPEAEFPVPPADVLLRLTRGFSCLFWGLPAAVLLATGAMEFRLRASLKIPAYLLGVLLIFLGILLFERGPALTAQWRRRIHQALFLLMLQVYLAPFIQWWRAAPGVLYYSANVLVLLAATMGAFYVFNQLAAETGTALGDRILRVEASLCGWVSMACLLLPAAYVAAQAALLSGPFLETADRYPVALLPYLLPRWMYALALLPFALTMTMAWRARALCWKVLCGGRSVNPP